MSSTEGNTGAVYVILSCSPAHPQRHAPHRTHDRVARYLVFGCDKHDLHHEHFDYNFGTNGLMDSLFGTDFAGSARDKAIRAKAERRRQEKVEQASRGARVSCCLSPPPRASVCLSRVPGCLGAVVCNGQAPATKTPT